MSGPDIGTVAEMFSGLYAVTEKAAWNGLALTYLADQRGRPVVLALLPIDAEGSPEAASIFDTRARALRGLSHPRLVTVTNHGVQHGVPFLELEHVAGPTLAQVLERGPLPRHRALTIARRVLKGLDLLEAVSVRHLDLTPSNVVLGPDDDVRIVGTGVAQILRSVRDDDKTGPTGKGSGPSPGRYLAPELLVGDPTDHRADVYSVGALLHHMVTGVPLGKGGEPPDDLRPIIAKATKPKPGGRYARAAAMRAALEGVGARTTASHPAIPRPVLHVIDGSTLPPEPSRPPSVRPSSMSPPKRSSAGKVVAIAAALAVVGGGVAAAVILLGGEADDDVAQAQGGATTEAEAAPEPAPEPEPEPEPEPAAGDDTVEATASGEVDLLAGELPEPLAAIAARVEAGEQLTVPQLRPLQSYAGEHRDDARPHLIIARAFLVKGWNSNAVERYLQAYQADPQSRRDTRMLSDLIQLSTHNESGPAAATAIVRIYGRDAIPAIDAKLEEGVGWPGEQRLQRLRTRLRRQ